VYSTVSAPDHVSAWSLRFQKFVGDADARVACAENEDLSAHSWLSIVLESRVVVILVTEIPRISVMAFIQFVFMIKSFSYGQFGTAR
jgi:hypothetical protein